jgi:hypothetical protein
MPLDMAGFEFADIEPGKGVAPAKGVLQELLEAYGNEYIAWIALFPGESAKEGHELVLHG